GAGAGYALLSQGLILTYVGSGVLNLAQGAMAMFGGFLFWQFRHDGWPFWAAMLVALLASALMGALIHNLIMRPLQKASSMALVVATLGILITLESIAALVWGQEARAIEQFLPSKLFVTHGVFIGQDRLTLIGIAVGTTLLLWAAYRFTRLGAAIRATAENRRASSTLGWSPDVLATLT